MVDSDLQPLALAKIPRHKLTHAAVEQLLTAIAPLPPGTRLPTEKELMAQLGVGRSTVREALKGLALMGRIVVHQGQGAFVAEAASATLGEPDLIAQALARGVTHELLEARRVIEVALAELAAARRTELDLRALAADLEAHAAAITSDATPDAHATQFHALIAQAAQNDILDGMYRSFRPLMIERGPKLYEHIPDFASWELQQHRQIYLAIEAGDQALAASRMQAHVDAMAEHYRRVGVA